MARYPGTGNTRIRARAERIPFKDGSERWTRAKAIMDINKQTIRCCGAGQTNLNSLPPHPRITDRASYLLSDKTFFLVLAKPDLAKQQFSSIHL